MVTNTPEPQDIDPPALTTEQARGHVMTAVRMHDAAAEQDARGKLAEAKIATAVKRALAVAPPLKPAQISRLSTLLRTGGVK